MGNACFCTYNNYFYNSKINICFETDSIIGITEKVLSNGDTNNNQKQKEIGINKLKKYFDENDNLIEKEKLRKYMFRKKRETILGTTIDIKYEIMLKRLLEQKNIKRKGPKRRKTIRNNENGIIKIIEEVILENKNENKNKKKEENKFLNTTLIIKNKQNSKKKQSTSIIITKNEQKDRLINNINNRINRKLKKKQLKNAKTLNGNSSENINEGNGSSLLYKKETNKK
jgi:hypothetical protein